MTALRIYHGPAAAFPGPPITATLGVDNIGLTLVPLPGAAGLALLAASAVLPFFRRTRRARPAT